MRKLLFCGMLLWGWTAFAACHAVTPSGAGSANGSSWSNAFAGLPGTLTAGDTYYLADGTYLTYSAGNDGSLGNLITVKKATSGDQGQGCGIGAGWNLATMGSGQASFPRFNINASYFTLDGVTRNTDWTGGGIHVTVPNTSCDSSGYGVVVTKFGPNVANVTVQYVEMDGGGYALNPDTCSQTGIYVAAGSTFTNLVIQYNYIHDVSGNMTLRAATAPLIQYNFFARNQSTSLNHSEAISDAQTSGAIIRFNRFLDIVGTGVIVEVDNTTAGTPDPNFELYGNLMTWTPGNPSSVPSGISNGVVSCGAGHVCTGWKIYNNTIAGCNWSLGGTPSCGIDFAGAGSTSSVTSYNNLWYNSTNVGFPIVSGGTTTHDFNAYFTITSPPTEANGQTASGSPFVGVSDFHLASDTNAWTALASPYNVDLDGVTRTSSRGAYQITSSIPVVAPAASMFALLK